MSGAMATRLTEDRDGFAGAVPSMRGYGGHIGAPMSKGP
jgi:hypothetical protein